MARTGAHTALRRLLAGGDRRSIAGANRVVSIVRAQPERVGDVAALAEDEDWLVAMRALEVLEKRAHDQPDWIRPSEKGLIGRLAESGKWEIRLQIVRALSLVRWRTRERARAIEILRSNLAHPRKFVRAWALDSVATMSIEDSSLRPVVHRAPQEFEASGSQALQSRARHIRLRLASSPADQPAPPDSHAMVARR